MFGNKMRIEFEGFGVTLRPPKKEEMVSFAEMFSSMVVQMYTLGMQAQTPEDEEEWWEKTRKDPATRMWGIVPDGADSIVGVTGIHQVHPAWGSCSTGILIADTAWWGKGVAYRAHLGRTWYAVNILNRMTIQSHVRTPNKASLKALLKVGYRVSGMHDVDCYRMGEYLDTYILSWVNPNMTNVLYPRTKYPNGIPSRLKKSLKQAKQALEFADSVVKFL